MISRGFIAVLKMHIKQQILSRAFVFSTILMPVLMLGIIAFQAKMMTLNRAEKSHVFMASDEPALLDDLQEQLDQRLEVKNGTYRIDYQQVAESGLADYLASKRPQLLENSNNALFYIPATAVNDKQVQHYSTNLGNQVLRQAVGEATMLVLNRSHFASLNVSDADIRFAAKGIDYKGFTVKEQGQEQGSFGNMAVGFGLAILLMLSMMGIVMPFQASILEEKSNRAVEVLLTSVRAEELLAGKILARTITGLAQMLIWLLPLFVFVLFPAMMTLPAELKLDLDAPTFLFFFANYVFGLTTMLAVWGGFSAMFDSTQDAGQAMWPVAMLMWLPFYALFAVVRNPANSVAELLSIAPFTSLYVMPLRMSVLEVPAWQPLLALLLDAAVCWLAIKLGGKIYRISVLSTGQQPTMQQFWRWLSQP